MTPRGRELGANAPLAIGLGGTLLLAAAGFLAPGIVLHGWLIAFVSIGGIAFGSIACLAIHGLTGGRWGDVARPSFRLAAGAVPLLAVLGLPLIAWAPHLYRWAADPGSAGPGVAAAYLNSPFLGLRAVILIGGLSAFARVAQDRPLGVPSAALCLLFYAVGMNFAGFDWILSLDPRFNASAFGAQLIIQQIAAAVAFAILTAEASADDAAWGDLGALLLALVLAESYLVLMTFIVEWYGDLPEQAAYYLERSRHGWQWLEGLGALCGAVLPMLALLMSRVRRSPSALRAVAAAVLIGIWAEDVWLIAPQAGGLPGAGGLSAIAGLLGALAVGALMLAAARYGPFSAPCRSITDGV